MYAGPGGDEFKAKAIERLLASALSTVPSIDVDAPFTKGAEAMADRSRQYSLSGNVVAEGGRGHVAVMLELRSRGSREVMQVSASDSSGNVWRLSDALARGVIGRLGLLSGRAPLVSVAAGSTASMAALREFVAGEEQFLRGQWVAAQEFFAAATRHDSTFALAHYRLSEAANWNGDIGTQREAAHAAWMRRYLLPLRERLLVDANAAWNDGDVDRAEAGYRDAAARFPRDAEAWYQLGEVQFHSGPVVGRPMELSHDAYRRVAALPESGAAGRRREALLHLTRIAGAMGDSVGFDSLASIVRPLLPVAEREELATLSGCVHRTVVERARLRAIMQASSTLAMLVHAQRCAVYGSSISGALARYRVLRESVIDSTARLAGLIEEAALRAGNGDRIGALQALGPAVAGGYAPWLLLHRGLHAWSDPMAPAQYLRALRDSLERGFPRNALAGVAVVDASFGMVSPSFAPWVAGLLSVRLGDDDRVAPAVAQLRTMRDTLPVRLAAANLAHALLSYRELEAGHTATALAHLDSMTSVPVIPRLEYVVYRAPERLIRARVLSAQGQWDQAAAVAQTLGQRSPYEFMFTPAATSIACRALLQTGRTSAAAALSRLQQWRGIAGFDCKLSQHHAGAGSDRQEPAPGQR
ncbi:MAG: hypothetical protein U5K74_11675 [Gemmatimonadaceae bacterium]|nr:hypothetical protein [Gemmatimonadaceae bacterium]